MVVEFPLIATYLLTRKKSDSFAPALSFPVFYLIWFWFGSIPLLPESNATSLFAIYSDQQWFCYLLGLVGYYVGCLAVPLEPVSLPSMRRLRVAWNEDVLLTIFAALALASVGAWTMITIKEGIPLLSADVETLRVVLPSRHHMAYQVMVLSADLMFPLVFLYLWTAEKPRYRTALLGFCGFLIVMLISQGNRGMALPSLLTVFGLRHYLRASWKGSHIAIATTVVVPLISVTGYFRSLQHFGPSYALDLLDLGIPIPLQPFVNIYLYIKAPLSTFHSVMGLIPAVTPYQHGILSVGFLAQLLPGRHPSSDFFFKDLLGHTFQGFGEPASLLGTFYGDFGVTGIFVAMFVTGGLTSVIYSRMTRGSIGWILVYCFMWQKLVGSLYGSLFSYIFEVLTPIAWIVLATALTGPVRWEARGYERG